MSEQVVRDILEAPERSHVETLRARLAAAADHLQAQQQALTRELSTMPGGHITLGPELAGWQAELARIGAATAAISDILSSLTSAEKAPAPASIASFEAPTPLALLSEFSQQLTLIRGVDAGAALKLNELGIHTFADIAALQPEDVREIARQLGDRRRISREGWIEQASLLADGIDTDYAVRVRNGDFSAVVTAPKADPVPAAVPPSASATAKVIPISAPRPAPSVVARPRANAVAKAAGIAASAAVSLLVAATVLTPGVLSAGWSKDNCSPRSAAALPRCAVAQLP